MKRIDKHIPRHTGMWEDSGCPLSQPHLVPAVSSTLLAQLCIVDATHWVPVLLLGPCTWVINTGSWAGLSGPGVRNLVGVAGVYAAHMRSAVRMAQPRRPGSPCSADRSAVLLLECV